MKIFLTGMWSSLYLFLHLNNSFYWHVFRFMVVRHPFERLLSAYRDKLEDLSRDIEARDGYYFTMYGKQVQYSTVQYSTVLLHHVRQADRGGVPRQGGHQPDAGAGAQLARVRHVHPQHARHQVWRALDADVDALLSLHHQVTHTNISIQNRSPVFDWIETQCSPHFLH